MLSSWLHVMALAVYLGAVVGLLAILLPCVSAMKTHEGRAELLARGLKLYNPLQTGALGVLLLSGAFQITELKAVYRGAFAQQLGATLAWKLALAFVLILFSTYQTMGVGLRFVRRQEGGDSFTPQELERTTRRLKVSTYLLLALSAVTVCVGLRLKG